MRILKSIKKLFRKPVQAPINCLFTYQVVARVDPGEGKKKWFIRTIIMSNSMLNVEKQFNAMLEHDNYLKRYSIEVQQVMLMMDEVEKKEPNKNEKNGKKNYQKSN